LADYAVQPGIANYLANYRQHLAYSLNQKAQNLTCCCIQSGINCSDIELMQ